MAAVLATTALSGVNASVAGAAEVCPGADRLVVVLDGPVSREQHPWADVAKLPDDVPLRLVTTDGTEDVLWARPTEATSFEDLAGWLIQQSGVVEVQCPPEDFVADVELLPFPEVIERPDSAGVPTEQPSRGGRGDAVDAPVTDPAPDGDAGVGGADVGGEDIPALPATGLPNDLLLLAFAFGSAGVLVLGATRVSV